MRRGAALAALLLALLQPAEAQACAPPSSVAAQLPASIRSHPARACGIHRGVVYAGVACAGPRSTVPSYNHYNGPPSSRGEDRRRGGGDVRVFGWTDVVDAE
jgi:hypothetical protein